MIVAVIITAVGRVGIDGKFLGQGLIHQPFIPKKIFHPAEGLISGIHVALLTIFTSLVVCFIN
jgi:hypothetical protein